MERDLHTLKNTLLFPGNVLYTIAMNIEFYSPCMALLYLNLLYFLFLSTIIDLIHRIHLSQIFMEGTVYLILNLNQRVKIGLDNMIHYC